MGVETSEQVMVLLKELHYSRNWTWRSNEAEEQSYRLRQQRHQEITAEIKALAKQSKEAGLS